MNQTLIIIPSADRDLDYSMFFMAPAESADQIRQALNDRIELLRRADRVVYCDTTDAALSLEQAEELMSQGTVGTSLAHFARSLGCVRLEEGQYLETVNYEED